MTDFSYQQKREWMKSSAEFSSKDTQQEATLTNWCQKQELGDDVPDVEGNKGIGVDEVFVADDPTKNYHYGIIPPQRVSTRVEFYEGLSPDRKSSSSFPDPTQNENPFTLGPSTFDFDVNYLGQTSSSHTAATQQGYSFYSTEGYIEGSGQSSGSCTAQQESGMPSSILNIIQNAAATANYYLETPSSIKATEHATSETHTEAGSRRCRKNGARGGKEKCGTDVIPVPLQVPGIQLDIHKIRSIQVTGEQPGRVGITPRTLLPQSADVLEQVNSRVDSARSKSMNDRIAEARLQIAKMQLSGRLNGTVNLMELGPMIGGSKASGAEDQSTSGVVSVPIDSSPCTARSKNSHRSKGGLSDPGKTGTQSSKTVILGATERASSTVFWPKTVSGRKTEHHDLSQVPRFPESGTQRLFQEVRPMQLSERILSTNTNIYKSDGPQGNLSPRRTGTQSPRGRKSPKSARVNRDTSGNATPILPVSDILDPSSIRVPSFEVSTETKVNNLKWAIAHSTVRLSPRGESPRVISPLNVSPGSKTTTLPLLACNAPPAGAAPAGALCDVRGVKDSVSPNGTVSAGREFGSPLVSPRNKAMHTVLSIVSPRVNRTPGNFYINNDLGRVIQAGEKSPETSKSTNWDIIKKLYEDETSVKWKVCGNAFQQETETSGGVDGKNANDAENDKLLHSEGKDTAKTTEVERIDNPKGILMPDAIVNVGLLPAVQRITSLPTIASPTVSKAESPRPLSGLALPTVILPTINISGAMLMGSTGTINTARTEHLHPQLSDTTTAIHTARLGERPGVVSIPHHALPAHLTAYPSSYYNPFADIVEKSTKQFLAQRMKLTPTPVPDVGHVDVYSVQAPPLYMPVFNPKPQVHEENIPHDASEVSDDRKRLSVRRRSAGRIEGIMPVDRNPITDTFRGLFQVGSGTSSSANYYSSASYGAPYQAAGHAQSSSSSSSVALKKATTFLGKAGKTLTRMATDAIDFLFTDDMTTWDQVVTLNTEGHFAGQATHSAFVSGDAAFDDFYGAGSDSYGGSSDPYGGYDRNGRSNSDAYVLEAFANRDAYENREECTYEKSHDYAEKIFGAKPALAVNGVATRPFKNFVPNGPHLAPTRSSVALPRYEFAFGHVNTSRGYTTDQGSPVSPQHATMKKLRLHCNYNWMKGSPGDLYSALPED